jgi:GAF domain-containing protein/ANTAR domain-containing protein
MDSGERLRADLGAAMTAAGGGLLAADELCRACVDLIGVDGAAISFMHEGASHGTFGSSGELSRRLDEFQFTLGQGPCLDAVAHARPVLVPDLAAITEQRWPAFTGAVLGAGVRAVFAFPVSVAAVPVGAIDLFCYQPGPLGTERLDASLHAADLAALPLLDLMGMDWTRTDDGGEPWTQLASLERVEVYQATGMIMAQLGVGPAEALIRLRAHAFAHDQTASEVAWAIVGRTLSFDGEQDAEGSS